ncbi:MAG: response regulator transcription factor [Gammaproteobacteria bacterium]|nr:response regulator transcription factor [Gammaproteobacteria bacterium]
MYSVVIVDRQKLFSDGLTSILNSQSDLKVAGRGAGIDDALRLVREHRPDVLVLEVPETGHECLRTARQISKEMPDVRIMAVSPYSDPWQAQQAFRSGARGFLIKGSSGEQAANAVRQVAVGGRYIDKSINNFDVHQDTRKTDRPPANVLTKREIQIVTLIGECFKTSEIAEKLGISGKTVDSHRKNIIDKLDIHTMAGLTRYAIRHGLVELSHEER